MTGNVSRTGTYRIAAIFEKIGFVFREQPIEDYGIDAIIEERGADCLTGKLIGVQIKCGNSFFQETDGDKIIYRGESKHLDYWLNYALPVIIVLYNPDEDFCVYESISSDKVIRTRKNWKIKVDTNNRLDYAGDFLKRLGNNQSEYDKRLSTLAFSKGLMELADQEKLIIEVMEWINKCSGRGEFIIKTSDNKELYHKTIIGFGLKPYDKVIQELFPWVQINIDEYYYEMYGDKEFMESFHSHIYPYCNSAGEVDCYRLLPRLNEIGKSFLTLDSFLNDGEMYNIKF